MDGSPNNRMLGQIANTIQRCLPAVMAIYIYGSTARGDDRPDSDLDIAVLLPTEQQLMDKLALSHELSGKTSRQVDLVDLRRVGNFLRMEVLREGKLILDAAPDQRLAWEGHAMTDYAHHRAGIRGILEAFHDTGIGYRP